MSERALFSAVLLNLYVSNQILSSRYIFGSLMAQLTEDVEDELRCIEQCSNHLHLFMKNVLSLDKILDGTFALPSVPFSPAKLCAGVKAMARRSAQPGVTIEAAGGGNAELMLQGAPTQLNLMLLNLVSNAAKFTTEGTVTLSATVLGEVGEEVEIYFAVTDTGVGIPKDKQKGIFEMRSQTGGAESQSKGFGIGLNIASRLAILMGGSLEVRSPVRDNRGSEFGFTLNMKKAVEMEVAEEEEEVKVFPLPVGLRVLIVDDSLSNRKVLSRKLVKGLFEPLNWLVELAKTGEEALALIDAGGVFDLIVMDENMHDAGGVLLGTETTRIIREREGEKEKRALIFGYSGSNTEEDRGRGRESGQDWFWEKPAPREEQALLEVARLWTEKGGGEKEDEVQIPGAL